MRKRTKILQTLGFILAVWLVFMLFLAIITFVVAWAAIGY